MRFWSSIFGPKPKAEYSLDIRPSGLLMDADGWYYEESLDPDCSQRSIRVQQDRPGDWYVRKTNCRIAELNSPSRAGEVLGFFGGSFRWLRFERETGNGRGDTLKIIGTYLDQDGATCESHLGYVDPENAAALADTDSGRLWGRIRCIRPPGRGRQPTFCLRYDLLIELDEKIFGDDKTVDTRQVDFLPAAH